MTVILTQNSAIPSGLMTKTNNDAVQPSDYRQTFPGSRIGLDVNCDVPWTRSSFPTQGFVNGFGGYDAAHQEWEWNVWPTGTSVRKQIRGVVKDVNGNPVSGATVLLFNTATGLLVDTQVSAADGSYHCGDPNVVNCFVVAYLSGSPDTAGTTVDTLVGA